MSAEPAWETVEVPREPAPYRRPLIFPPGGGRLTPYTRCTTYIDCLEDKTQLTEWKQRKVAEGLAVRRDLLGSAQSLGPEPDKYTEPERLARWRGEMNAITKAALGAAGADARANVGTTLHRLTERVDRGEVFDVQEEYRRHVENYRQATAAFTISRIERFTVHDGLRIGGTPDRVVAVPGEAGLTIADLKTGDTEYGVGKIAMQLAIYSRSQLYDPATGERRPYDQPVNQDRGLVIALNPSTGEVELKWVDLIAGWHAVQLATQVRAWRSAGRRVASPYYAPSEPAPAEVPRPLLTPAAGSALLAAIDAAATADELVELWRAAGAAWAPEHTARAASRKAALLQPA